MIKKTLTYLDYEGNEHTKDFYFSMNQTEFSLLNNRIPGGYEAYLKRIQEDHDEAKLLELLTTFIVESYGERTADGLKAARARGRLGGRPKIGDEKTKKKAIDLYKANVMSNKAIADAVRVSTATLSRWIKEAKEAGLI